MKRIRIEKYTTPIGQEVEDEWFEGTPEEAEGMIRDGECDGLIIRVGKKEFDAVFNGSAIVVSRSTADGETISEELVKSISEFIGGRKFEFSPQMEITI